MTRVEGAINAADVAIDARTGANIRGSSMAALLLERRASELHGDFSRCSLGPCTISAVPTSSHHGRPLNARKSTRCRVFQ